MHWCQEHQSLGGGGGRGNQEPGFLQSLWPLTHCVTLGTIFNSFGLPCKIVVFNCGEFYPPSKGTVSVLWHNLLSQLEAKARVAAKHTTMDRTVPHTRGLSCPNVNSVGLRNSIINGGVHPF